MSKVQKGMLSAVLVLCLVLMVILSGRYLSASRELSSLKKDLDASTAVWKQINEEKLAVQKDLKEVRSALRETELTIVDAEERAEELKAEIETLEKEIESLRSGISSREK